MSEETVTPLTPASVPTRRVKYWAIVVITFFVLGLAWWYIAEELPRRERAANARTISDLKLDLVWIAPGEFLMGEHQQNSIERWFYEQRKKLTGKRNPFSPGDDGRKPTTQVTLTQPFWLGRTEVTQAQWAALMGNYPSKHRGDDLPVETVSWTEAMEFCRKLTERERAAGRLPAGYTYTLPTEAQWEYACRAGNTRDYVVGESLLGSDYMAILDASAWYANNSGDTTHPVGTKRANAWGLYDMRGNVVERSRDWLGAYPGGSVIDPTGPSSGSARISRGGSYLGGVWDVQATGRNRAGPNVQDYHVGFRVALVPAR
jgi:formylglycine-generating enzyme required for sulfatase activity